ncbi:alpha/beta-Hydrolases superfamily protein [Euphorbia peplus]|nr:alpha/beta-Hydrolases superfamily protein [Euphorbia peplus]
MIPKTAVSKALNARIEGPEGSSETIVLAHGYGGDQSAWDEIVPELAKTFKVVTFDWSFSGAVKDEVAVYKKEKYSSYDAFADDLISLIEELSPNTGVVFVGHSMSGMIGCIASIKKPHLFKTLVLIAASPRYINIDEYEGGFKKSDIEDLITNIESNFLNWAPAFASLVAGSKDPLSAQRFVKSLTSMAPDVAASVAKTVFYSDYRDILDKVTTPCTIVQTQNDMAVPNSVAYYLHQNIKAKSTVEIMESDGHFPHLTAPHQLLNVFNSVLGFSS